jgi:hypothetical protein
LGEFGGKLEVRRIQASGFGQPALRAELDGEIDPVAPPLTLAAQAYAGLVQGKVDAGAEVLRLGAEEHLVRLRCVQVGMERGLSRLLRRSELRLEVAFGPHHRLERQHPVLHAKGAIEQDGYSGENLDVVGQVSVEAPNPATP